MKKQNGITLVALIITIIVMLILAGIGISIAMGDNGILKQAQNSKTLQEIAVEKDKILTAQEYMTEGENRGNVSYEKTKNSLNELGYEDDDLIYNETDNTLTVKYKNQEGNEKQIILENVIKENTKINDGIWYSRGIKNVVLNKKYISQEYGEYIMLNEDGAIYCTGTELSNENINLLTAKDKEEAETNLNNGYPFSAYFSENVMNAKGQGGHWSTYTFCGNYITWADEANGEKIYYFYLEE